jgi:undecaprenyl-diphosphatase
MAKAAPTSEAPLSALRRRKSTIIGVLFGVALLYVAIPQLGFFDSNWQTLLHSNWRLLGVAMACLLLSFAAASVIYMQLSPRRLRFGSTYVIQIAGAFAGKVLPAGLGSISVNYLYLRRQGCRPAVAGTVVAINNLLGFVGHGVWLLLVALLLTSQAKALTVHGVNSWVVGGIAAGLGLLVAVAMLARRRLRRAIRDIVQQLRTYRRQPGKLVIALAASMLLTACNITILWLSAHALHAPLTIVAAAVALTTGILAQTVTPTPGGLGGVEAGLVGGLVLANVKLETAVTATILFRFVTYWLPLALGGIALLYAVRRKLL